MGMAGAHRSKETLLYNVARALTYLGFTVIAAAAVFIFIMVSDHG
jgi:hypothetical protein